MVKNLNSFKYMPYKSVQAIEQEKIRSSLNSSLNAFHETIPLTLQELCIMFQ